MSLLVETIRIENGKIRLIDLHNERANRSRKILFGETKKLDLRKHLLNVPKLDSELVKCRILYGTEVQSVEFSVYKRRDIKKVQFIDGGDISYKFKYALRPELDALFGQRENGIDEICIIDKRGFITDAYYYNYVFEKDGQYFTPDTNLLDGIMRTYLLQRKKLTVIPIHIKDIQKFENIHLINALNPLGQIVLKTSEMQ